MRGADAVVVDAEALVVAFELADAQVVHELEHVVLGRPHELRTLLDDLAAADVVVERAAADSVAGLEHNHGLAGGSDLQSTTITVAPGSLPVGQAEVEALPPPGRDTVRVRFLVSFSNQWVITNFDEMQSLLRYFERQEWVDSLRKAPPDKRPDVWRAFWKATDPVPITPENEALDDYFKRVQQANIRYQDEGQPGWLTDRGFTRSLVVNSARSAASGSPRASWSMAVRVN